MLRWLLAATLVTCAAPGVSASAPPTVSVSRAATSTPVSPTTAARSPTPDPNSLPKCAATQLQAVAAGVPTTDLFAGAIFVANRGTTPCTLRGSPALALLAGDGSALDVMYATVSAAAPAFVVVPVTAFRQDPAGLLGIGASAPLRWSNYCDDALPKSFRVTLPDAGGMVDGTFVDLSGKPLTALGTPRCDDGSGPSTVTLYPFQEPVP